MSEKSKAVSFVLHLSTTAIYALSVYTLLKNGLPEQIATFGYFKSLTFWNLNFQLITFAIALLVDIVGGRTGKQSSPLVKLLDLLFNSLALPFGIFVAISFWGLYAVDKELIYPESLKKYWLPMWLNHSIHTLVLPVVLLENYLVDHRRRDQNNGLSLTLVVTFSYWALVLYLGIAKEFWVYPVLAVLEWPFRAAFIICSAFVTAIFYRMGGPLYDMAWSASAKTVSRKRKSGKAN